MFFRWCRIIKGFVRFRYSTIKKDWILFNKEFEKVEKVLNIIKEIKLLSSNDEECNFVLNYVRLLEKDGKGLTESALMGLDLIKSRKEFWR